MVWVGGRAFQAVVIVDPDTGQPITGDPAANLAMAALLNTLLDQRLGQAAPPAVAARGQMGTATAFARADHTHENPVKWAAVDQATNASGIYTKHINAGLFTNKPGIICGCKAPGGSFEYRATVVAGSPDGWDVTVAWTKRKATLPVPLPAIVIGAAALTLNVSSDDAPGVVVFDIIAVEGSA